MGADLWSKKPYGVDFKAYRYNASTDWFEYLPEFQLKAAG